MAYGNYIIYNFAYLTSTSYVIYNMENINQGNYYNAYGERLKTCRHYSDANSKPKHTKSNNYIKLITNIVLTFLDFARYKFL